MFQRQRILVADSSKYFDRPIWYRLIPEPEFEIVGLAGNAEEAVKWTITLLPDIILLDLSHSEMCGLQTVKRLHVIQPDIPIITLIPISSQEYIQAALGAGAAACLTKSDMADVLLQTLRDLMPVRAAATAPFGPVVSNIYGNVVGNL